MNGVATSLRVLRELGAALVDFNGQHAAQGLREAGTQLALLDRLANTTGAAEAFGRRLEALRDAHARLAAIDALGSERQRARLQALVDQASPLSRCGRSLPYDAPARRLLCRSVGEVPVTPGCNRRETCSVEAYVLRS